MWGREALGCDFLRATVFIVLLRARKTLPHGKTLPRRSQSSPRKSGAKNTVSEFFCALQPKITAETQGSPSKPGKPWATAPRLQVPLRPVVDALEGLV